jgi:hypothetical protein
MRPIDRVIEILSNIKLFIFWQQAGSDAWIRAEGVAAIVAGMRFQFS